MPIDWTAFAGRFLTLAGVFAVGGVVAWLLMGRPPLRIRERLADDVNEMRDQSVSDVIRSAVEMPLALGIMMRVGMHALVYCALRPDEKPKEKLSLTLGPSVSGPGIDHDLDMAMRAVACLYGSAWAIGLGFDGPAVALLIVWSNIAYLALDPILGTVFWMHRDRDMELTYA